MAGVAHDSSNEIEKLYEYGGRLNESGDKSLEDYKGIIEAAGGSVKAKQLAAQLIPKFFKHFPTLSAQAIDQHFNLCEDEELGVRVQAIRGLPLFCKDTPEYLSKIVDVLGQLLPAGENVERDAVHKALMSLLRQDVKTSLTVLFKLVGTAEEPGSDESIREKVLCFIRDKVFPLKAELLKPEEQMERHITDLVKKSLQDVTGAEFKMFMDFLKSLSLFGKTASVERIQELVEIIEGQADIDAQFDVSDADHVDRLISCLRMAIPLFMRGASGSKFLIYLGKHIIPVFDKLSEERKEDLLKNLAECSCYASPQDSRQLLPSVVPLLKKHMIRRKLDEMNFTFVECLLYVFHHLAHKTPNATNSLCGYKIVTGQPSDRLGEDFSEQYKDFTERLSTIEDLTRAMMKKLTQGMTEHNKEMAAAKTDEAKNAIKAKRQTATTGLRTCNNILAMTQSLHSKSPTFIGDQKISLSWKETVKPSAPSTAAVVGSSRPKFPADDSEYLSGFGNHLASEAIAGALPRGQNSPLICPFGLYAEQISGTSFTAPRKLNHRNWLYRIKPSVTHEPFKPRVPSHKKLVSEFDQFNSSTNPTQIRWRPVDTPEAPTDFIDGLYTVCGAGSSFLRHGFAIHMYAANKSMEECAFCNADGDFLIVPQKGRLWITTECGKLQVSPGEIVVLPQGFRFAVDLPDGPSRGYVAEVFGAHFHLPDLGPIGANGLAAPRDFLVPIASFEDRSRPGYTIVQKFGGELFTAKQDFSPFNVVAWHGNYVPYKYDLSKFCPYNTVLIDHGDPSINTVLTAPTDKPGVALLDFVIFPPRWLVAEHTFRPPYYHRNCMSEFMGLIHGGYEAKADGFLPGGASLHSCMTPHGPDTKTYEATVGQGNEAGPHRIDNTMAFMFESCLIPRICSWALDSPFVDQDYYQCWIGLRSHFMPETTNAGSVDLQNGSTKKEA